MSNKAVTGTPLKEIRESQGFSQRSLAEKAGVPRSVIQYTEAGQRVPHGTTLHKLARALNVTVDELLAVAEDAA